MKQSYQQERVTVVLIRHAQSQWNLENRFTGWADPPLTDAGRAEARQAGDWLRLNGYEFDAAFSSCLQRANKTLAILLDKVNQADLPTLQDWRLNERHYGALQGVNKAVAMTNAGEQQVWRWRRGYEDRAAPLARTDISHPVHDPRYANVDARLLPDVENLAETRNRVMAFWHELIVPRIQRGERLLISAHGNTLRALIMDLAGMSVEDVEGFEIPTAMPILYHFNQDAKPMAWHYMDTSNKKVCA